jgi:hypothetical protein
MGKIDTSSKAGHIVWSAYYNLPKTGYYYRYNWYISPP